MIITRGGQMTVALCVIAALALAACGPSKSQREQAGGRTLTDLYTRALAAKDNGNCAEAMPHFERLARIGRGWEVAQVQLAQCHLEAARAEGQQNATAEYQSALRWLRVAAASNEATAQASLAQLYFTGEGVGADTIEAATWYVLAQKSAVEGVTNLEGVAPGLNQRLETTLTPPQWEEARIRAAAWSPTYQDLNEQALPQRRPGGGPPDGEFSPRGPGR